VNIAGDDGVIEQMAVAAPSADEARLSRLHRERFPIRVDDPGGIGRTVRTGEAQLITDVEELHRLARNDAHQAMIARGDVGSAIVVPMEAGGATVGALGFVNRARSRAFDHEDLELAIELARRVGLALESVRIAEERTRVADALQRELLPPSLPRMPGWDVATMYEPAGELNEVGGDFYEVFAVERGWAVVLGDVSGKGAAAASLTAEARHTIRTAGTLAGDPRAGLRLLDENLRSRDDVALCSVAIVVLPEEPGAECNVDLYLAGHPHPVLLSGDGADAVGEPGPLLGVIEGASWRAVQVPVRAGDQLVLYTDGVIEARGEGAERFGADRLRRRLAGCASPEAAVERVRAALDGFGARPRQDDAALVAIRCSGYRPPLLDDAPRAASSTSAAS
jgi:phosphoserine phosphatase RsbU/P